MAADSADPARSPIAPKRGPVLERVLSSAAQFQAVVPDAVLVGDSAAALFAGHRESFGHDHVLADLATRYDTILEAVEATEGWATSVRTSRPPMTLLGSLGGIETGLRQMRRSVPLETERFTTVDGLTLTIPTLPETLRVKGYLVVNRHQTRDFLDVAALSARAGSAASVEALATIDTYYADRSGNPASVLTALVQRLADPQPADSRVTEQLQSYRGLNQRWHAWGDVTDHLGALAQQLLNAIEQHL